MALTLRPETAETTKPGPTFRERWNRLHRRLSELSLRVDPPGEEEYHRVVDQIAKMTSAQNEDER